MSFDCFWCCVDLLPEVESGFEASQCSTFRQPVLQRYYLGSSANFIVLKSWTAPSFPAPQALFYLALHSPFHLGTIQRFTWFWPTLNFTFLTVAPSPRQDIFTGRLPSARFYSTLLKQQLRCLYWPPHRRAIVFCPHFPCLWPVAVWLTQRSIWSRKVRFAEVLCLASAT